MNLNTILRSDIAQESFKLTLPLFEITSAISFPIKAKLVTDIDVNPDIVNSKETIFPTLFPTFYFSPVQINR